MAYVRYFIFSLATCLLAFCFAHAHPTVNSAVPAELERQIWRVPFVAFEPRSGRGRGSDIYPGGDDGSDAYLSFKNGGIGGSLGCGNLTGRYDFVGSKVRILAVWADGGQRCGAEFRKRTGDFIFALNSVASVERRGEGVVHLFDEQKNYFIRLQLLSPGVDLSETRGTFWRLVNLDGNVISELNAEVKFGAGGLRISIGRFFEEYSIISTPKNALFKGPWSASRQYYPEFSPVFEAFEENLSRITSYIINDEGFSAFDSSGKRIMRLEQIRSKGLEHRFWRIIEYATELGMRPTVGRPMSHVITFAQGKLQGTAACTGYEGDYMLTDDSLSVRASEITLAGSCSRSDRDEDLLVVNRLNNTTSLKQDGDRMLLQDSEGHTRLVLIPYSPHPTHRTFEER